MSAEETYDQRVARETDELIAQRGCKCWRVGETVYPCHLHIGEDFEDQYGAESDVYLSRARKAAEK